MPLSEKLKNTFPFLLRLGLSVGLLLFVFSKIDMERTAEVLKTADPLNLFWAWCGFMVVNVILLFRWFIFIKALDLDATKKSVVFHYFYGLFGNLFLPSAIGGDLLKAVGLCKGSSQKPRVVASILIDRLSGFASIAIVAIVAFVFGYKYVNDNTLIIPIALMAAASITIASILLIEPIYALFCKIFNWWPKFKKSLMTMHYDLALLKESHKMMEGVKGIMMGCVSQLFFASTYYFTAKALHQEIAVVYFLIFVPIICVVSSLPSIGGLGVREVGAAYLFGRIGIESGIAVSMALISFLFMVVIGIFGGLLYVYTISTGRIQHHPPDAGLETG